ncbi:PBP1A family penicillin-binding protein [bacterium]|nr:PBP1A family penicillin-binding protein [bacterium]
MKRTTRNFEKRRLKLPKFLKKNKWLIYPVVLLAVMVMLSGIILMLLAKNLPSLTQLERATDPLLVTRIYSKDGKILKELYKQKRIMVPLDRIPQSMINATVAIEDHEFYHHWGINLKRFPKALYVDLKYMRFKQGFSTITMQLARKLYLYPQKTIIRKIREMLTAIQIERTYSKSEILEMYLNRMPLGRGTYGVQAASLAYFGKNVEDLKTEESALLAGLFQLPYGYYVPDRSKVKALHRRNIVLKSMERCHFINKTQYDSLRQLDINVIDRNRDAGTIAPYFCEYVRKKLYNKYGLRLYTDGLSIYTSLDTRVQACADSAINSFIPKLEKDAWAKIIKRRKFLDWLNPPLETEDEIQTFLSDSVKVDSLIRARATLQCALVAVEPTTGDIIAMVGGRNFDRSKYNRVTQMKRQPGSNFKPFAYTVAIDNGWSTTTELLNQPVVVTMADGTQWRPKNYDGSTGGPTTLREGLRRSLNLIAARLVQELIPPEKVVAYAKRFGFTTTIHPFDGVALGQDVVIPLELVSAYSVFANKGIRVAPTAILRVEDKYGNVLEKASPRRREVISSATAYIMTDMLETVINKGTGQAARWKYNFYRPAGGKTGTTNDYRNTWFSGFTPQITSTVWVGFDDERLSIGDKRTGANTALPVWAPFMRMAHDTLNLPLRDFKQPEGVVRVKICAESKKIATASCPKVLDEVFLKSQAPVDTCDIHRKPGGSAVKGNPARKRIIF